MEIFHATHAITKAHPPSKPSASWPQLGASRRDMAPGGSGHDFERLESKKPYRYNMQIITILSNILEEKKHDSIFSEFFRYLWEWSDINWNILELFRLTLTWDVYLDWLWDDFVKLYRKILGRLLFAWITGWLFGWIVGWSRMISHDSIQYTYIICIYIYIIINIHKP